METRIKKILIRVQRNEITEHFIYMRLAEKCGDHNNAEILHHIGEQEKTHADYWKSKTGIDAKADRFRIFYTVFLARTLGLTFVLKLMEKREGTGAGNYRELASSFPESLNFSKEEQYHESELLKMLDEERLKYVGSIVLGLNDALIELTGALAGFTLALGDTKLISLAGLVTGISATLSMAASDYLSSRAEGDTMAKKSAVYTGISYLITVMLLIMPYLLLSDRFTALAITLLTAVVIVFCFNYYISVSKDLNFRHRFLEMTAISLGVAAISFLIGFALKNILGVDVQ